jgi:hypothetical protein
MLVVLALLIEGTALRVYEFLTKDTKTFDWFNFWVFLAFQVATLLFVAVPLWFIHRRNREIRNHKKTIREFMAKGQQLRTNLPVGSADIETWTAAVTQLIQDAATFLEKNSPDALAVFLDTTDMTHAINAGIWVEVSGDLMRLNHALRNLRSIMENAGEYFQ